MSDCVFCDIVAGARGASRVLETDAAIAFMDLRQANRGHVLVIPRDHVPDVFALSDETGAALMAAVVRVARAVRDSCPQQGLSIWQSNGPAAHQEVPHVHFHVHPRLLDDGLLRVYPERPERPARPELDELAARIRRAL